MPEILFGDKSIIKWKSNMKPTTLPYETLTNSFVQGQLFWAVENFCSQPELRDEGDLDENQLREAAKVALQAV